MADSQFIVENGIKVSDVATVNTELNSTTVTGTLAVSNNVTASANLLVGKTLTVNGNLTFGNTTSTLLLTGLSANIATDTVTFMNVVTFKANVNFDTPVTFTDIITSNGDFRPYNNTYSLGNTTNRWSELYVNNATVTTSITVGTISVNTTTVTVGSATVNSTIYTGTANNATNLGGLSAASYANLVYVNNQVGNAYSNAIIFASNASNINTGTLSAARLTAGNSTAAGILQVIDSVSNTSITIAAAANSVKLAYDTAIAAGNAALAYSNATTYADNRAANAYSNAIIFAANASNINVGTVAVARLPVGNTTVAGILQLSTSTSSVDQTVAATASAVKTAFDNGSTAYSNAVANTTAQLAAYTGTSNVVTVGTIGTGTWNATVISAAKGGTGNTSMGAGIVYSPGSGTAFRLATGAEINGVLSTNKVANAAYADSAGSAGSATTASTASALTTTAGYQVGSLGVGTANSGTNNGQIRATGDITAFYSSDRRLKENISNISDALLKINSINGVEFDWTEKYIEENGGEDSYFMRKHDVGVIAQELQSILPEAVAERNNGTLAVKYERIVPLLIEAVKELSNKVKELEQKLLE